MNIHQYKPFDREEPLQPKAWEDFCQEYLRLDIEREVPQMRERRICAYRHAYPNASNMYPSDVNVKATALLRKKEVAERLAYLYEQECSGIESEVKWNKNRAEDELLNIIFSPDTKDGDKLKAIGMLNELREIGIVKDDKDKIIDTVQVFFNKIGAQS